MPAEADGCATEVELFTMALGEEAIYLVPGRSWSQLDVYKWRARGILPGTPPGLEICLDHVKVGGLTVATTDPDGCDKLERALNEWLLIERQTLEHAKQKLHAQSVHPTDTAPVDEPIRFQVGLDKTAQPHIHCYEGKQLVADIGCTVPGITSLIHNGFMRKPATWKLGVLRDWLELDGQTFQLKNGQAALSALEQALNEHYRPGQHDGSHQVIKVFTNPASPSGFDIQFTAAENGLMQNRRRHLDAEAIELLSDSSRCRVFRKDIVVKFTPPTFHFKRRQPDGSEYDLVRSQEHFVRIDGQDGQQKWIDLSQPISHLGLGPVELTAIFNHPSISRHGQPAEDSTGGFQQAA